MAEPPNPGDRQGIKKTGFAAGLFLPLNDEHQGEGGTLVFIAVNITTLHVTRQGLLH
jgi:hypothetical protein